MDQTKGGNEYKWKTIQQNADLLNVPNFTHPWFQVTKSLPQKEQTFVILKLQEIAIISKLHTKYNLLMKYLIYTF